MVRPPIFVFYHFGEKLHVEKLENTSQHVGEVKCLICRGSNKKSSTVVRLLKVVSVLQCVTCECLNRGEMHCRVLI